MQYDTHFLCFTRKIDSKRWGKKSGKKSVKKVQKNGLNGQVILDTTWLSLISET